MWLIDVNPQVTRHSQCQYIMISQGVIAPPLGVATKRLPTRIMMMTMKVRMMLSTRVTERCRPVELLGRGVQAEVIGKKKRTLKSRWRKRVGLMQEMLRKSDPID